MTARRSRYACAAVGAADTLEQQLGPPGPHPSRRDLADLAPAELRHDVQPQQTPVPVNRPGRQTRPLRDPRPRILAERHPAGVRVEPVAPESSAQWVVTAYALTFGGLLIVGGRASDVFGVALLGSLVGRAGTRYVDGDTAQPGADPGTGLALAAGLVVLAALVSLAAPHRGERRKRDQARRSLRAVS